MAAPRIHHSQHAVKITITVAADVRRAMLKRSYINWSKVANEAFREKILVTREGE